MRVIQLSDFHLYNDKDECLKGCNTYSSLQNVLQHIKKTEKKADAFILTGDLSQTGEPPSYQLINSLFGFTQKPVYALAGNHDDLLEMREQMRKKVQCVHSVELGEWQILMLHSPVQGAPHGHISEADLNWLKLWLAASKDKHTLIAVHHHPVKVGSDGFDDIMLDNGDDLLAILKEHEQVKAVVFGHIHQEFETHIEHIRILSCPSTSLQYQPKSPEHCIDDSVTAGYRWLELNNDGSIETGVARIKNNIEG